MQNTGWLNSVQFGRNGSINLMITLENFIKRRNYMPNDKNIRDDNLDLVLTRTIDVPREVVWKLWTEPEHVKKWFAPKPWTTVDFEIDLRPGGKFRSVMRSPEGKDY